MKLSGEATLHHPVEKVYEALNNPAVLVRTIPGCQRLEQTGPDTYKATVLAGVASIKGTFDGDVRLTDQQAPYSFALHASGTGAPGTVSALARVTLAGQPDGDTLLTYDADATFGGVIGGVGQRMLSGVARKTAAEFFAAVDREMSGAPAPALTPTSAALPPAALPSAASTPSAVTPAATAAPPLEAQAARSVWTRPAPLVDPGRQRMRDVLVGAAFGAAVALLGVLIGAIVARW